MFILIYCNYKDWNAPFQDNVAGHPDLTYNLEKDVKLIQTMNEFVPDSAMRSIDPG